MSVAPDWYMRWKYRPLRTMLEPRGRRLRALSSWVYFRNQNYTSVFGDFTFVRIFGWEKRICKSRPKQEQQ